MADEWNLNKPTNDELVSDLPGEHRERKTNVAAVLEKEHATLGDGNSGGQHLNGAAVAYVGTTAPTDAPDGSTSLSTGNADKGRLYIDDNFDPPILCRWDGSAVEIIGTIGARLHASGDGEANAYIINLYKEDAAGGRGCRLIGKGTQSGAEVTTLGYIEFAHDGSSDDQKGKFTVVVNDGDDSNSPSKKAIQYSSDGKIVVANSISVLDEDAMGTDSAVQLATQQSIKAYVAAAVVGVGFWKTSGATVFNTTLTTAATFQDLDLSGTIGSNAALVYLEIKCSSSDIYVVKPKGLGGAYNSHQSVTGGGRVDFASANEFCYLTIATDSSGIIQHGAQTNTSTFTIKLIGFVK